MALAVAWAAYLIPKALQHHDEVVRSRSVDRFSHRMRVLARREPVNGRNARLVVTPGRAAAPPVVTTKGPAIADARARREAVARATRRRRRVLGLLLLANVAVIAVAAFQPDQLVVGRRPGSPPGGLAGHVSADGPLRARHPPEPSRDAASTTRRPRSRRTPRATRLSRTPWPRRWGPRSSSRPSSLTPSRTCGTPLPVTLPTYVSKPAARRTVRTIDLDETGVWSSGRSESDSALAREADEAERGPALAA